MWEILRSLSIDGFTQNDVDMMLLHVCCGDCGIKILESAEKELGLGKSEMVLYFYNPNIHPRSELLSRQRAVKKLFSHYKIITGDWEPRKYFKEILCCTQNDVSNEWPSKEIRCPKCWELRLEETFIKAKEEEIKLVSSTLFSSQYQDFEKVKEIGEKLAKKYEIEFWVPKNIDTQKCTSGFYKQNYCGCCYSLVERMEEKYKG